MGYDAKLQSDSKGQVRGYAIRRCNLWLGMRQGRG